MREKINQYLDLEEEIRKYFNICGTPIDFYLENNWVWDDEEVLYFGDEYDPNDDFPMDYRFEQLKLVKDIDGLICFYTYGNGDERYSIFDNSMRLEWKDPD